MSKITIGITELREDLGRDDGIEGPNRGPSFSGKGFVTELRFWDDDDYDYEISSILSSAHAWTSVILGGETS